MSRQITPKSNAITIILILVFITGITGCINRIGRGDINSLPLSDKIITDPDSNWIDKADILLPSSTLDLLACVKCHKGLKVNIKRRKLTGTHIDYVFNHPGFTTDNKWCYSCHSPLALDSLRLDNNRNISYEKSYKLCIQCHITNYRFWTVGLHGRRTGMWNGEKQYLSCIYCHNAHSPKFKPIEPKKPPLKIK